MLKLSPTSKMALEPIPKPSLSHLHLATLHAINLRQEEVIGKSPYLQLPLLKPLWEVALVGCSLKGGVEFYIK